VPYQGKVRAVDAGPVGILRLTKRDTQDRRAAVQAPSATGGAPKRNPGNVMAGGMGEEPLVPVGPAGATPPGPTTSLSPEQQMRFQQPAELTPILPHLRAKGLHDIEKYAVSNPEIVRLTANFVREKQAQGFNFDTESQYTSPEEFAADVVAAFQRRFEPSDEPLPLYSYVHQTRDGREIYRWLQRVHRSNVVNPTSAPIPGGA